MFRLKQTCTDYRSDDFDKTVDCPATGCSGSCIECFRMFDGCSGCKDLGFEVCPTFVTIENCACTDGTKEKHNKLAGCWVGFVISDDMKAKFLAIAAADCPEHPDEYQLEFYGSTYSFGTHATTTSLNCPRDTTGWTPIPVAALVPNFQGAAITRGGDGGACDGGAFFLSVGDIGIITKPLPDGAGPDTVSCSQEGGCVAFMMRIKTACGTIGQIGLCPFLGVTGTDFNCSIPPDYCDDWDITLNLQEGCDIRLEFTHKGGECAVVCTVAVNGGAPLTLTGAPGDVVTILNTIDPCPGGTTTIVVTKTWDPACVHECQSRNGSQTYTFTAP